ncbi:MAG: Sec-independent protein translocase subunit TatB [Stackebrandtia sp.]
MFSNINMWEIAVIVLVGLFIFGPDRFPKLLADLGKGIRKLRTMARNATADIQRETGMDIDITDLHPKTFIRKHVLSEADEEAIKNPLKSALNDISKPVKDLDRDDDAGSRRTANQSRSDDSDAAETAGAPRRRYDDDAT